MTHLFDGYNYLVRLEKGEQLTTTLEQFVANSAIKGGWISGLGAAHAVEIGYYNLGTKDYKWRTFGEMLEVVSLSGNIAYDETGKITFHFHGVFADDEYQLVGGHVRNLIAGATLELFIHCSYQEIKRKFDEVTGLQLFDFQS